MGGAQFPTVEYTREPGCAVGRWVVHLYWRVLAAAVAPSDDVVDAPLGDSMYMSSGYAEEDGAVGEVACDGAAGEAAEVSPSSSAAGAESQRDTDEPDSYELRVGLCSFNIALGKYDYG